MMLQTATLLVLVAAAAAQVGYWRYPVDKPWNYELKAKYGYPVWGHWGYPLRQDIVYQPLDKEKYAYVWKPQDWRVDDWAINTKYIEPFKHEQVKYVHPEVKYVQPFVKEDIKVVRPLIKEEVKYVQPLHKEVIVQPYAWDPVKVKEPAPYSYFFKDGQEHWNREVKNLDWTKPISSYEIKTPEVVQWNAHAIEKPIIKYDNVYKSVEPLAVKPIDVKVEPVHYVQEQVKAYDDYVPVKTIDHEIV